MWAEYAKAAHAPSVGKARRHLQHCKAGPALLWEWVGQGPRDTEARSAEQCQQAQPDSHKDLAKTFSICQNNSFTA